jgi:hypothetical protein
MYSAGFISFLFDFVNWLWFGYNRGYPMVSLSDFDVDGCSQNLGNAA